MNSDFERAMIWGLWGEYESVYNAFIQEQVEINRLCALIGKPALFRQTFEDMSALGLAQCSVRLVAIIRSSFTFSTNAV